MYIISYILNLCQHEYLHRAAFACLRQALRLLLQPAKVRQPLEPVFRQGLSAKGTAQQGSGHGTVRIRIPGGHGEAVDRLFEPPREAFGALFGRETQGFSLFSMVFAWLVMDFNGFSLVFPWVPMQTCPF